jgi:hypothetical protein
MGFVQEIRGRLISAAKLYKEIGLGIDVGSKYFNQSGLPLFLIYKHEIAWISIRSRNPEKFILNKISKH